VGNFMSGYCDISISPMQAHAWTDGALCPTCLNTGDPYRCEAPINCTGSSHTGM
jgi:hypothetical protein